MKTTIDNVFSVLQNEFAADRTGRITFTLANSSIIVKQNNVVGNIIEEWLDNWLNDHDFDHIYNHGQCSPDFWLDTDDLNKQWLEIKSFTGSPNFDIANFLAFIQDVIDKPWKLDSKYLILKYNMNKETGIVTVTNTWLKHVWEISSPSYKWAIKVQDKKDVIYNLRPANWTTQRSDYDTFKSLEHFLSALDYVIKLYPPTSKIGMTWKRQVENAYSAYYGVDFHIPLWQDIASQYPCKKNVKKQK